MEKELDTISRVKLITKDLKINCFDFADDMSLLAKNWKDPEQHIKELEKQSAKIGLKISVEKIKILTNIKNSPSFLDVSYTKIDNLDNFKHLGEWSSWNSLDNNYKSALIKQN